MARCLLFNRSVDSIVVNEQFYENLQHGPEHILSKIKDEPPDIENNGDNDQMGTLKVSYGVSDKDVKNAMSDKTPIQLNRTSNNKENIFDVGMNDVQKNAETSKFKTKKSKKRKHSSFEKSRSRKRKRQKAMDTSETVVSKDKKKPIEAERRNTENSKKSAVANSTSFGNRKKNSNDENSQSALFECEICLVTFDTFALLRDHKYTYSLPWKYECRLCLMRFQLRPVLLEHIQCSHSNIPRCDMKFKVICNFCGAFFYSKIALQAHMYHNHPDETNVQITTQEPPDPDISILSSKSKDGVINKTIEQTSMRDVNDLIDMPSKKLRQITLAKFLHDCPNVTTQELNTQANVRNLRSRHSLTPEPKIIQTTAIVHRSATPDHEETPPSTSKQNNMRRLTGSQKKPSVPVHADFDKIESLSNNSTPHVNTERREGEPDIIVDKEGGIPTVSSKLIDDPSPAQNGTSKVQDSTVSVTLPSRKENIEIQEVIVPKQRSSIRTRSAKESEASLRKRYKCKELTIRLERCDRKKVVNMPSAPKPQTASEVTYNGKKNNNIVLKRVEVRLERLSLAKLREYIKDYNSPAIADESKTSDIQCKVCKKRFATKKHKREHMRLFHMVYMSVLCRARFAQRQGLVNHYLHQHPSAGRKECCVCQETCPSRHALKRHLLLHCVKLIRTEKLTQPITFEMRCSGITKKYKCSACGAVFKMYLSLRQHRVTCNLWKKEAMNSGLFSPDNLVKQEKVAEISGDGSADSTATEPGQTETQPITEDATNHVPADDVRTVNEKTSILYSRLLTSIPAANDKLLPTPSDAVLEGVPGKSNITFNDMATNVNHKLVYPCTICGLQFQTVKNLWNHKRAYLAPNVELCNICGTVFPSKRFLRMHVNSTHVTELSNGYNVHCKYCGQGFCKKLTLRMHEAHFHNQQPREAHFHNQQPHEAHFHNQQPLEAIAEMLSKRDTSWNFSTMCSTCHVIFRDYDRFIEHNTYYFDGHTFHCTFCDKSFRGMYLLHHHNKMAHYPEEVRKSYNLTCAICNEGFKHESHFFAHKAHVHAIGPRPLVDDLRTLKKSSETLGQRAFVCPICKLDFSTPEDLLVHEAEFSNQGSYACQKCKRKCHTLYALNTHQLLTHDNTVDTAYKCPTCKEVLVTSVKLMCHEKHFHENNIEQTTSLEEHSQQLFQKIIAPSLDLGSTKNMASTFTASEAQAQTTSPKISVKNIASLTGIASPDKGISIPAEAQKASSSNSKEIDVSKTKPGSQVIHLQCNVCLVVFKNMKAFIKHRMLYTNSGKFQCEFCPRKFMWRSLLDEHQHKHCENKGKWPYTCSVCSEGFRSPAILSSHIIHIHPATAQQAGNGSVNESQIDQYKPPRQVSTEESERCDITFIAPESEDPLTSNQEDLAVNAECTSDPLAINQINNSESIAQPKRIDVVNVEESQRCNKQALSHDAASPANQSGHSSKLLKSVVIQKSAASLKFICPVCLSQYQNLDEFQKHFVSNHHKLNKRQNNSTETAKSKRRIECVICDSVFSSEGGFRSHLLNVHMPRIRVAPTNPGKPEQSHVIYRVHALPIVQKSPTAGKASPLPQSGANKTSTSNKITVFNIDEHQPIRRLKVKALTQIASSGQNSKFVRIISIKNLNNTRVSVQTSTAKTPANL